MSEINILYSHISDLLIQSIPKRIGAYTITHTKDNIHAEKYVGSTKNLYNRMRGHYNKKIIHINLYITDDIEMAQSLERILMELINPATNIQITSLSDKDTEIMKELLEDTNIKECISNNITKIGYRYLKYITRNEVIAKMANARNKIFIVTVSSTLDYEIAMRLENDAVEKNITISQLIRNIINEKYKVDRE